MAGAASNGAFSISPATIKGQLPRTYFQPQLFAGQSYHDVVNVVNQGAQSATFNLYATDAINTAAGAFTLLQRTAPKKEMGAWIQLPYATITLKPDSYEAIPFQIIVPPDATPGDHAGGIVIEQTEGTVSKHGSVNVTVLQAVGVRVYGRVQGNLLPDVSVTKLSVSHGTKLGTLLGGGAESTVTFTVVNTGNERLSSTAIVSLSPLFGGSAGTKTVSVPELLPQNSVTLVEHFRSVVPYGFLTATVHLTSKGTSSSGSASDIVVPWLLVLLILLIIGYRVWRKRRIKEEKPTQSNTNFGERPVEGSVRGTAV